MTTSMWDIRYPGTTKTSSTRKLLKDFSKFPLRAVFFVVPSQFYSLWPQTWVLRDTHPAICGTAGLGSGARRPTGPPPAGPVTCAAPSLSAHSPSPRGPRLSLPLAVFTHCSLPALLCHRERDASLTCHTPQGSQITIFFRWLSLHVHLPCLRTVSSPCRGSLPFSAFS